MEWIDIFGDVKCGLSYENLINWQQLDYRLQLLLT